MAKANATYQERKGKAWPIHVLGPGAEHGCNYMQCDCIAYRHTSTEGVAKYTEWTRYETDRRRLVPIMGFGDRVESADGLVCVECLGDTYRALARETSWFPFVFVSEHAKYWDAREAAEGAWTDVWGTVAS